mgnify:CR=1 FL=1
MESTGLKEFEKIRDVEPVFLSESESKAIAFYDEQCIQARDQRTQTRIEFDDMTYEQDYELNEQAKNSYLRRKKNDDEVRVNTGTTEKKIEAVQNELMSMNLQPEINAFDDQDNEYADLSRDFTDIVRRTNEIEHDDDFWVEAIQELLCQRACFVEEIYNVTQVHKKKSKGEYGSKGFSYTEGTKTIERCEKKLLSGLQVYLGDITIPLYLIDKQPFIFTYDRIPYRIARTYFETWDKWNYVQPGMGSTSWYQGIFKQRFNLLQNNEVEIRRYASTIDDEYQIIINGVPMLPPGTPRPWDWDGYNIIGATLKPMSRTFAYGKPLTASSKTLQALDNETIRLMIRKFRQAVEPPLGVKSGKIYSKDIWSPGAITQGVLKNDFERLIDHNGVTDSEMAMYDLIKRQTEEFIGASNVLQGVSNPKKLSATEVMNQQRQAIKMLGFAVLSYSRLKRDATMLRIKNILQNYTKPIGKEMNDLTGKIENVYRKFTAKESQLENGKNGKKIVQFMGRDTSMEEEQDIYDYTKQQDMMGQPMEIIKPRIYLRRDLKKKK